MDSTSIDAGNTIPNRRRDLMMFEGKLRWLTGGLDILYAVPELRAY
jgi:hypothetical protein